MSDLYTQRQQVIRIIFILSALLLVGKTMHLQLFDRTIQDKARTSAFSKKTIYPSRGLVYDRNGQLLTFNDPIYDLMVTYNQLDPNMDTTYLCELLDIDKATFIKNLDKDFKNDRRFVQWKPYVFMSKLSVEAYAKLQESLYEFPGFSVQLRNTRTYPDTIAAHILGYVSEVSQSQINNNEGVYKRGDYIGTTGLERIYEKELRGEKGEQYLLKDNLGRIVGSYRDGVLDSTAVSGKDLFCTIDIDLQRYAEHLMQNKRGSIVAIEPSTGEILCMSSAPTYDPNLLSINADRGKIYTQLQEDPSKPLFNRAISAKYPPGSLFKPIVGLIAMQEGVWDANWGYTCGGSYHNIDRDMGCHAHPRPANMKVAISHSCNSYFFHVFRQIIDKNGYNNPDQGLAIFNKYLYAFGLGKPLGVDFPSEKSGFVPTTATYDRIYPSKRRMWKSPTIISMGIGQGELELTTLQMANLAAIIGNKGSYITPHLVKGYLNADIPIDSSFAMTKTVPINTEYFEPVIDGMENVIRYGTGYTAQVPGISVCGKTGTAQNPHGEDHSIFFAFAPKENPQIAIAVYIENGGFGTTYAAPMAGLMIEKYINGEVAPNRKYIEDRMTQTTILP